MKIELTEAEYKELKAMHKKTKDGRERDKIKAVILLSKGYTVQETADILLWNDDTVSRWRDYFMNRKSLTDWLGYSYVGYDGKLSESVQDAVRKYVTDQYLKTSRIVLELLPPYSPNLNLIERLWKFMRKKSHQ